MIADVERKIRTAQLVLKVPGHVMENEICRLGSPEPQRTIGARPKKI